MVAPPAVGTAQHTLEYWSVDTSGNEESPHKTTIFSVTADTTPPVTTSDAKAQYWHDAVIKLTATDDDANHPIPTTYYRFDSGATQSGTTATLPASGDTTHMIYFWAVDYSGNVEAAKSATFHFGVGDTTPPTTSSSFNPAAGATFNAVQPVTLTATDNTQGSGVQATYYKVDSAAFAAGTTFTVSADGLHTFSYYSVD